MTILPVTLLKGDKVRPETEYGDAIPTNMYAVTKEILGAAGYMLEYPGITLLTLGSGADRGAFYNERFKLHYRVSGNNLISVPESGAPTVLGTITGSGQCSLINFYSFQTQAIIGDGKMFLHDPIGGFREVTDVDLGTPLDGVWINGVYFMTDGEYIFHTDLNNESSINPLKFATAEFMPDPSLGVGKSQDNKAMVFGRYTIEYFADSASANFAYSRVETRAIPIGIVSTHAKCQFSESWYILGGRRNEAVAVYIVKGNSFTKVSSREIDKIIAKYKEPELADVRLEVRQENNVTFLLVHLPSETLCFNESVAEVMGTEAAWCRLKTGAYEGNYRAINCINDPRIAKWVCGDKFNEKIGYIDATSATQYDDKSEWELYTPFVDLENKSIHSVEIETIPGFTTKDDAKVAISQTIDGHTYGSEYWMNYGKPGKYNTRFIIRRLGYCDNWVGFKFRGISDSRMAFALMEIDVD